jgi:hypothetical protein
LDPALGRKSGTHATQIGRQIGRHMGAIVGAILGPVLDHKLGQVMGVVVVVVVVLLMVTQTHTHTQCELPRTTFHWECAASLPHSLYMHMYEYTYSYTHITHIHTPIVHRLHRHVFTQLPNTSQCPSSGERVLAFETQLDTENSDFVTKHLKYWIRLFLEDI